MIADLPGTDPALEGRDRAGRRTPRLLAQRAGCDRQRRRRRGGHGGGADPQGDRRHAEADHPVRAVERRGGGPARIEGLRRAAPRGPGSAPRRATSSTSTSTSIRAPDRSTGSICRARTTSPPIFDAWLEPFKSMGARKNVVERIGNTDHLSFTADRPARLQSDPGLRQLRRAHASHQHGHARARPRGGPAAGGDRVRLVRLARGDARREDSTAAGGGDRGTLTGHARSTRRAEGRAPCPHRSGSGRPHRPPHRGSDRSRRGARLRRARRHAPRSLLRSGAVPAPTRERAASCCCPASSARSRASTSS